MKKQRLLQSEIAAEAAAATPGTRRSGVLVLNGEGKLLYLNPIAKDLLEAMRAEHPSSSGNGTVPSDFKKPTSESPLPHPIMLLHRYFKNVMTHDDRSVDHGMQAPCPIFLKNDSVCFARAIRLQSLPETPEEASLLILMETFPPHRASRDPSPHLTEREQAVVTLLFDGKTNKEVASSMGISEHTVKEHMKRIMRKLHVPNRAGIVAHFVQARVGI